MYNIVKYSQGYIYLLTYLSNMNIQDVYKRNLDNVKHILTAFVTAHENVFFCNKLTTTLIQQD